MRVIFETTGLLILIYFIFFLLNYIGQRFLSGKSKHQVNFTVLITVSLIETGVLFIFIATGWFFEV